VGVGIRSIGGHFLLIIGGEAFSGAVPVATAEIYDPNTERFTPTGSMLTPRASHRGTLLPDGRELVGRREQRGGIAWLPRDTTRDHPGISAQPEQSPPWRIRVMSENQCGCN